MSANDEMEGYTVLVVKTEKNTINMIHICSEKHNFFEMKNRCRNKTTKCLSNALKIIKNGSLSSEPYAFPTSSKQLKFSVVKSKGKVFPIDLVLLEGLSQKNKTTFLK